MSDNKIEMSVLDPHLPKHYKGFDIDVLIQKIRDNMPITNEEEHTFNEVWDIYYNKYFDESQKRWDKLKKTCPGPHRKNIDPNKKTIN